MRVRELLLPIIRETLDLLASGNKPEGGELLKRLDEVRTQAVAQMATNRGVAASFVSAVNLLVDCVRGRVDPDKVRDEFAKLNVTAGWDTGFSVELLRNGTAVKLPKDGTMPMGSTAINWTSFLQFYAKQFGYNKSDPRDVEQLWIDLTVGSLHVPVADLHLADPTGGSSTWVTDDMDGGRKLRTGDPERDVYDAIGLTWQPPNSTTRGVLISCRMDVRAVAAGSLHCPTAIDGWGNLLFVPRQPTHKPWPDHGAATARPTSDGASLPEAIHGPAKVGNKSASLFPIRELNVGDRVRQYGADVMVRALGRLRDVLTP